VRRRKDCCSSAPIHPHSLKRRTANEDRPENRNDSHAVAAFGSAHLNAATNTAGNGVGDIVFSFGQNGDIPLAGDWDGKPPVP
jgi:hypothetical protein